MEGSRRGARARRPFPPAPVALAFGIVAALWFVNLTNFMDGLDWMTVANFVPILPRSCCSPYWANSPGGRARSGGAARRALSALRPTIGPWLGSSWAMSAACPWDCLRLRRLSACRRNWPRSGGHPGTLLRRRRDADVAHPAFTPRKGVGSPPQPFLSARDGQWLGACGPSSPRSFVLNFGLATLALVAANADGVVCWTALASAIAAVALVLVAFRRRRRQASCKGTVLLTGGSGFVGRALALSLAGRGVARETADAGRGRAPDSAGAAEPVIETVRFPGLEEGGLAEPARRGGLRGSCRRSGPRHRGNPRGTLPRRQHLAQLWRWLQAARGRVRRFVFLSSIRAQCGPNERQRSYRRGPSAAHRRLWADPAGRRGGLDRTRSCRGEPAAGRRLWSRLQGQYGCVAPRRPFRPSSSAGRPDTWQALNRFAGQCRECRAARAFDRGTLARPRDRGRSGACDRARA